MILKFSLFSLCSAAALMAQTPAPGASPDYDPSSVKFVVGGIVPAGVEYRPLTQKQLWALFANENFQWKGGAYFRAFGSALPDHLNNRPEEWGQGTKGYMTRVGDRFTRFTMSSAIQYAGQSALGHDPRYVRCKCDGFWPRFGHASLLSVATYNRKGDKVFNVMNFAGAFGGEYIGGLWNPSVNPVVRGYQGAAVQVGSGWMFNVLREFGPDIKRAFTRNKP